MEIWIPNRADLSVRRRQPQTLGRIAMKSERTMTLDARVQDKAKEIQEVTLSNGDAYEDVNYYQQPEFSFENVENEFN
jgi:uncharacterized protein YaeQ